MPSLDLVAPDKIPLGQDVPTDNLIKLVSVCTQMEVVCQQKKGAGLAAVQVGIPWKLFLVDKDHCHYEHYVNCRYEPVGEETFSSLEGCLSILDEQGKCRLFDVQRYKKIRVIGYKLDFTSEPKLIPVDEEYSDFMASVFAHEIDHGLGILISDTGIEMKVKNAKS